METKKNDASDDKRRREFRSSTLPTIEITRSALGGKKEFDLGRDEKD